MKASDLREKTREDLLELQKLLARDVFRNRLKNFTNRLDDTSAVRKTRRDLARVLTLLHRRHGATANDEPAADATPPVADAPKAESRGAVAVPEAPAGAGAKKAKASGAVKNVARAPRAAKAADQAADEPAAASGDGARRKKPAAKKGEAKE
jgi:large subunit ribosomal protein L29